MPPPGDGYTVDIAALRTDATTWSTSAQTMHEAATTARSLHLEPMAFSYPGIWAGLATTYQTVQDTLARLLTEGEDAMMVIADTLTATANAYEHAETTGTDAVTAAGSSMPDYNWPGATR